jgi:hypothetical protein
MFDSLIINKINNKAKLKSPQRLNLKLVGALVSLAIITRSAIIFL